MKVNKEVIIKNINAILCAFSVVGLVFPFCSMGAETSGEFASEAAESVTGLTLVTNGGMWGIIFIVAVVAIVAFNYVKQLCAYKKLGCLCGSALMTVATFLMSTALAAGADAAGDLAASYGVETKITYGFGFYIILICALGLTAVSVINFFNLKGNAVFDAINNENETENGSTNASKMPNVNFGAVSDKIEGMAKSIGNTVSSVANQVSTTAKSNVTQTNQTQQSVGSSFAAAPKREPINKPEAESPVSNVSSSIIEEKENSEYIMEKIEKLFEMKEKGILTEEEFAKKKSDLLEKM